MHSQVRVTPVTLLGEWGREGVPFRHGHLLHPGHIQLMGRILLGISTASLVIHLMASALPSASLLCGVLDALCYGWEGLPLNTLPCCSPSLYLLAVVALAHAWCPAFHTPVNTQVM